MLLKMKSNLSAAAQGVVLAVATLASHQQVIVILAAYSVVLAILTILATGIVLAITTSVGHFIYS